MNTLSSILKFIANRVSCVYKASGTTETIALASGTPTNIPLSASGAVSTGSGFAVESGGIRVEKAGIYRITASAYVRKNSAVAQIGVYARKGTTWSTATEVLGGMVETDRAAAASHDCVVQLSTVASLAAGDVLLLGARTMSEAGTCFAQNTSTFLLVERLAVSE